MKCGFNLAFLCLWLLLLAGCTTIRTVTDGIPLPSWNDGLARGFSDRIFEDSKPMLLQKVDSIGIFQAIFGFVWNCLKNI